MSSPGIEPATESAHELDPSWRAWTSRCIAIIVVLLDIVLPYVDTEIFLSQPLLPLAGVVAILCINNGNYSSLGFRWSPNYGWKYWCRFSYLCALVIGVLAAICAIVWLKLGWPLPAPRRDPSRLLGHLYFMCLYAPVTEEVVYRSLLAVAIAPSIGERGTIIVSGVVFALVHVFAGNPGPDNMIAGFLLAWAFFRSRTILVPIAMHAAGNLAALGIHVIVWYCFSTAK